MNCRPVTPEVAGSSPVAPVKDFKDLARIWSYRVDTVRFRDELTLLAHFSPQPIISGRWERVEKFIGELRTVDTARSDLSPDLSLRQTPNG